MIKLNNSSAEIYIPAGSDAMQALSRVTHLAVGAHQDDIELLACHGILECFNSEEKWFAGVTCTDGGGSPRTGDYASYSDEDMRRVRRQEQRLAASIGRYAAMLQLDYPSSAVKDPKSQALHEDLKRVFSICHPRVVYTHNPADKHDTHVAVAVAVLKALRALPSSQRPEKLLGCEVWRDLDWTLNEDRITLDMSNREHLQGALMGIYDSQISGGKRYDLAMLGRRRANATFFESHGLDKTSALAYALDLTRLVEDETLSLADYVGTLINRFASDVQNKIKRFGM